MKKIILIICLLMLSGCAATNPPPTRLGAQQNIDYTTATTWAVEAAKIQNNFTDFYSFLFE